MKYQSGEIDFVFQNGKYLLPIEVKSTFELTNLDVSPLENFIKKYKVHMGMVTYGGVPHIDLKRRILFWPFWLV